MIGGGGRAAAWLTPAAVGPVWWVRQNNIRNGTKDKGHISVNPTHLVSLLPVFPSIRSPSKGLDEARVDGAAVMLTAASALCPWAVRYNINIQKTDNTSIALTIFLFQRLPLQSQDNRCVLGRFGWLKLLSGWQQQRCHLAELVDSNARWFEGEGWWPELDGCSDGEGAADNGLRGGWKEAGVFSFQHSLDQWRKGDMADMVVIEVFLSWWNENEVFWMQIKRGEGRERDFNNLNFYLRKMWHHVWIQIIDAQQPNEKCELSAIETCKISHIDVACSFVEVFVDAFFALVILR
jgi:hypothetical protein